MPSTPISKRRIQVKIKTHDLFLGAYIITNGGALDSAVLEQSRKGRQTIQFYFTGENVPACHEQYQSGQATANIITFKTAYTHLKDVMFQKLRENGEKEKESYANHQRRTRQNTA